MMHFVFHPISTIPDLKAFQFFDKMAFLLCILFVLPTNFISTFLLFPFSFHINSESCIVLITAVAQTIHVTAFVTA